MRALPMTIEAAPMARLSNAKRLGILLKGWKSQLLSGCEGQRKTMREFTYAPMAS